MSNQHVSDAIGWYKLRNFLKSLSVLDVGTLWCDVILTCMPKKRKKEMHLVLLWNEFWCNKVYLIDFGLVWRIYAIIWKAPVPHLFIFFSLLFCEKEQFTDHIIQKKFKLLVSDSRTWGIPLSVVIWYMWYILLNHGCDN